MNERLHVLPPDKPLFEARNISKRYFKSGGMLQRKESFKAVDDISLQIRKGEALGIVGESGSGKSTFAKLMVGLEPHDSGEFYYRGEKLDWKTVDRQDDIRTKIQMVFQDPYSSVNPRYSIRNAIAEPLIVRKVPGARIDKAIGDLLQRIWLPDSVLEKYPNELSGGMLQRVGMARALILEPEILVCDEPVAALDISISIQILALLKELNKTLNLSVIFISHDLKATGFIADNIAVFNLGRLVEYGKTDKVIANPSHDYTKLLLEAANVYAK